MGENNQTEETTDNTRVFGRRASDNTLSDESYRVQTRGFRHWFLSGLTVGGVVGTIFLAGRTSGTLDTVVITNDKQDKVIEKIIERLANNDIEQNRLLVVLENQVIQQKESDGRFEKKFDNTIETLQDMREELKQGIDKNSEKIINLQLQIPKVSLRDRTAVQIAMR